MTKNEAHVIRFMSAVFLVFAVVAGGIIYSGYEIQKDYNRDHAEALEVSDAKYVTSQDNDGKHITLTGENGNTNISIKMVDTPDIQDGKTTVYGVDNDKAPLIIAGIDGNGTSYYSNRNVIPNGPSDYIWFASFLIVGGFTILGIGLTGYTIVKRKALKSQN